MYANVGFPGDANVLKDAPVNAGNTRDLGSIPVVTRSPGTGNGNPLQHSCLENPKERGGLQSMGSQIQRLSVHALAL